MPTATVTLLQESSSSFLFNRYYGYYHFRSFMGPHYIIYKRKPFRVQALHIIDHYSSIPYNDDSRD